MQTELDTFLRRNRRKIVLTLTATIALIILILSITYVFHQPLRVETDSPAGPLDKIDNKDIATPEDSKATTNSALDNGTILLAQVKDEEIFSPSDPANPMREYYIFSINPQDGAKDQVALLKNNFFTQSFGYSDGIVYFINPHGELALLDLNTSREKSVAIEGIMPTDRALTDHTLNNFILFDKIIYYLRGICSEGNYCVLGIYDLATRKNLIAIDNLQPKVGPKNLGTLRLKNYDAGENILTFESSDEASGQIASSLYEINLDNNSIQKTASESFTFCNEDTGCTPEQLASNEAYQELSDKSRIACGETTIQYENNHIVAAGKLQKMFDDYEYVGCVRN